MKTKLIPFDLAKAKAGAKTVNRDGNSIRIVCDDVISGVEGFSLLVLEKVKGKERPYLCRKNGKANFFNESSESVGDLFIEEEGVTKLKKKKQGEHKSINNIKPEFKVGDYIVNDSVNMRGKIVKLTDHSYQFSSGKCIPFEDNRTRLWEVAKDAKPGDVLASEYWDDILIFKQIDDRVGFSSYYNINQQRDNGWVNDYFQPATRKQRKQLFQKMKEAGYEWDPVKKELKKIENEAVTNKINKPRKFKVGDFLVVNRDGCCIGKVVEITDNSYKLENEGGYFHLKFSGDLEIHPWTIKDAKSGDVLAGEHGAILIFKQIDDMFSFSSYYNIQQKRNCDWISDYFQPATKQQRELLFKKMKEEGYEWDSNKKELKKIENEAAGKVKKEVKTRKMTRQELSDWLRDCPEEHREWKYKGGSNLVFTLDSYHESDASEPVETKLIRMNHGEWEEPLIEIK